MRPSILSNMEIIYRHFDSLPSTNDWAKIHLETLSRAALTVITAVTQTQGRGRYGKRWISPAGENLYATFVFFTPTQDPVQITHLLALSTSELLQEKDITAQIKWPNDLLVNRKKIAGILCETVADQGIAIGIGLNVNMPIESLALIDQPATSILCETGAIQEIHPLLCTITERFSTDLMLYLEKGFAPFASRFQARLIRST